MEILTHPQRSNKYGQYGRSQSAYDIQDCQNIVWDRATQGVNKKLMRLAVDSKRQSRQSLMYDESLPRSRSSTVYLRDDFSDGSLQNLKITQFHDCDNARFPRMEVMSHFHYNNVDVEEPIELALCLDENEDISEVDTGQGLLVKVTAKKKSWILKRSIEDFIGLDRQIHRCIYDRRYSLLSPLGDLDLEENLTADMVHRLQDYLSRFSKLAGNNVNCGPILNWLELDNHGNHLVVMEADDSAINVPAIAAGRVIKRYQAQAADEITLDVGEFLSIIDMPPVEETIWWRGKKGYEVGFFPSHCIEMLGVKDVTDKVIGDLTSRPVSKRRGKFITFLRFFFKSRPSKDELMQNGILRERVFGCDLGERLALVGREIPLVLEMCSAVIEEYGIVDGIYRLSGILSNLQRLRISFDNGDEPPDLLDPRYLNDIHCISSLLKTYFRELPNPLFTHELYDKFVAAIDKEDDTEKTVAFHHVIQRLPPPHYRTMHALLRHLNFCALQAKETNMTAKNLAIVWAPNLLRPNVDSVSALTEFRTQAIIVEYMIRNVDVFFNSNLASAAIAYYPESVESTSEEINSRPSSATTNMGGTKLISLEEARLRVLHHRLGSESSNDDAASNSPRHKIRSIVEPPQLSAAPISPLPTLLSLEEAQARTRTTNMAANSRGSPDLGEGRNSNDVESPKRNKKWFGLFSKSRDDDVSKVPVYRKKGSGRHNLVISSPTAIPCDFQINSELHSTRGCEEVTSFTENAEDSEVIPLSQIDDELDMPMHADNDDIMSAIVSITAKYTSMPSRSKESQKASHRRSITIGEPSEFRRLNYISSSEPPTEFLSKTTGDSKRRSIDSDTIEDVRKPLDGDISTFEKLKDNEHSKISFDQNGDFERRFRSYREGTADTVNNVPAKKIRSFSPENYCNPPMNVEIPVDDETKNNSSTNNVNTQGDHTLISRNDAQPQLKEDDMPLPDENHITNNHSLSGTGNNTSMSSTAERSEPSKRGSKQTNDVTSASGNQYNDRASGGAIFQLVAVPRSDGHSKPDSICDIDKKPNVESEDPREEEVYEHPTANDLCTETNMQEDAPTEDLSHEISEQNNEPIITAKAMIEKAKGIDQRYKIRQFPRTADEKLKVEAQNKTSEYNIGHRSASVGSKMSRLKRDFLLDSNNDESRVNKDDTNSKYKSNSNELINKTNHATNHVERSYSLSVKDKVSLFNNPDKCGLSSPLNVDLRSVNETTSKSSVELSSSEQIRSAPNLYLHTEYSARPLPTSLCGRYKNLNNKEKEKECENCENIRRSTYSQPPRNNSDESFTKPSTGWNENKQPSRQQQQNINYSNNRRNSKDDKPVVQSSNDSLSNGKSSKPDRNTIAGDRLVTSFTHRNSKDKSKPPIKPRPLSEAQKHHTDNPRPPIPNLDRTYQDIEDYKHHRAMGLMSTIHQPPFFSLLQKSVSDNYLHGDSSGQLIGRFPLTLKNGSSMHSKTGFDRNSMLKKRDSRPLSMYDNVRHSYYDNLSSARYDLV